jgi:mycoketide-CoA synthase
MRKFECDGRQPDLVGGSSRSEPVAVVGFACRLPQAPNPAAFWRLLSDGLDAVGEVPAGRWNPELLPDYRRGGFLDDVESFDTAFFGISPKEATVMDPRQRLMLELSWEALEHARIIPDRLRNSRTSIFVGATGDDYATLLTQRGPTAIDHHSLTGLSRGIIANRVSYRLGLRGPSAAIDTAQSSSLVAVHMASDSLRSGESVLALAGGVQLNLTAESTLSAARLGALSADGRCYTFDKRANGFVRGEGGGLVILKMLSRAIADGDRIRGLILGSAVNNDGVSDGLTVPSQEAQQEVIEMACERAQVVPADIQYVELHGSATVVGDPIEAAALGAVLGAAHRDGTALEVGSVKTNIGHLEGAAGIAGLLKVVLSLAHRRLPSSLNFERPNPRIPLDELGLRVRRDSGPWPRPDHRLVAGVSSFGMGGTNCHVVLAEHVAAGGADRIVTASTGSAGSRPTKSALAAQCTPSAGLVERAPFSWVVSGHTEQALRAQAETLKSHVVQRPELDAADVGLSLGVTRSAFEHRAVVFADNCAGLCAGLDGLATGTPGDCVVRGIAADSSGPVMVFPGQGSQWADMGADLLASSDAFRSAIIECAEALGRFADWSLLDVLRRAAGAPELTRDDVAQPALWAVMVSLAQVWRSVGVRPAAVVGHSGGEIAAATVAGALSIADGARLVALRSQASMRLAKTGGMLAVALPSGEVATSLADRPSRAWLAAVNGPESTVVSGDLDTLDELAAQWDDASRRVSMIPVSYAAHSPHVEPLREDLLRQWARVAPKSASIPFASATLGEVIADTSALDAEYWFANMRGMVRFEQAVRALAERGHRLFVECSPHPVLTKGIQDTLGSDGIAVGTLCRDEGGSDRFWRAAAHAYVHGASVDWRIRYPQARIVDLPTYAFQRQRLRPDNDELPSPTATSWTDDESVVGAAEAGPEHTTPPHRAAQENVSCEPPWLSRLADMPTHSRRKALLDLIRVQAANVLGYSEPDRIEDHKAFGDLGFSSPTAVELRNSLAETIGVRLPATALFRYPTPLLLADYLDTGLAKGDAG